MLQRNIKKENGSSARDVHRSCAAASHFITNYPEYYVSFTAEVLFAFLVFGDIILHTSANCEFGTMQKFEAEQKCEHLVDLETCFTRNVYFAKSASMQPRTTPDKFAV